MWNERVAHSLQVPKTKDLRARFAERELSCVDELILKKLEEPLGGRP